jgi:acylphosphatase
MKCFQIKISGQILGEGLRFKAMHLAHKHQIKGFVQYDDENSLTIEAQGELNDLHQFVQFCRNWLSPDNIKDFTVIEKEPESYSDFTIRRNISEVENLTWSRQWFQRIKQIMRL